MLRTITWLASYPRSGNTYLRALLANYIHAQDRPVSLNDLPKISVGEHIEEIWAELTGKPLAERTLEDEWAGRAAYAEQLRNAASEGTLLVKTHTINASHKSIPAFEFKPGDRVIHLVRHPADVAISCADFYGIDVNRQIERMLKEGLINDSRPRQGFEVLGSWSQHVHGWLNETRIPVLTIRYADLVQAPEAVMATLAPYIGMTPEPARIAKAVEFTRFERLRKQEAEAGFIEASPNSLSGQFFRRGRPGQWRETLTPEQAERLLAPNRDLLEKLGFATSVPLGAA